MNAANPDKPTINHPPTKSNTTLIVAIVLAVLAVPLLLGGVIILGGLFLFTARVSKSPEAPMADHGPTEMAVPQQESTVEFQTRMDAARNIRDNDQRDSALAGLAKDAAAAGNNKVASDAINMIQNTEVREPAMAETATLLAKAGKAKEGMRIANMISDDTLRDEILGKIAKGE